VAGKIIFVNGAPFSGKTYLISHLTERFPHIKVVNYELFCNLKHGYPSFYNEVLALANSGHDVVAESACSETDSNPVFDCCLNIAVSIPYFDHQGNINQHKAEFGSVSDRIGSFDLIELRNLIKFPRRNKPFVFDGRNLESVKKVVENYVLDNRKPYDSKTN
jgi:hypothetical protein